MRQPEGGLGSFVRLFEADPDLLRSVPEEKQALLRRTSVPLRMAERESTELSYEGGALGLLILEGVIRRDARLFGRRAVELLGPGDLIRPWQEQESGSVPHEVRWRVLEPARLAVLDPAAAPQLTLPEVVDELLERTVRRAQLLSMQMAIDRTSGVGARLLLILWHLAERWGYREGGEVVLRAPLSQTVLADLVAAERESVNRALAALRGKGLIGCRNDRLWVLHGEPPHELDLILAQGAASEALLVGAG
jgi:CRP/FNR family transcriptional regulator, cyclic AMP receptor protein